MKTLKNIFSRKFKSEPKLIIDILESKKCQNKQENCERCTNDQETTTEESKSIFNPKKLLAYFSLASILLLIAYNYITQFLMLATGILFPIGLVQLARLIDDKILIGINTVKEIKKGNISYAIYFMSICLLLACGFLGAILVYFTLK